MAIQFSNNKQANRPQKGTESWWQAQHNSARWNVLLVFVFTAINILMLFTDTDRYFLFSAWFPYWKSVEAVITKNVGLLIVCIAFTVLALICFLLWKKSKYIPVITAGLFGLDCIYLVYWVVRYQELISLADMTGDMVLTALFHLWVAYYMVQGIRSALALEKMKAAAAPVAQNDYKGPEF